MKSMHHIIAATIAVAGLTVASHVDSTAILDNYETVLYNPAHYEGARVLWGGSVQDVANTPHGTRLVIAEIPLDFLGAHGSKKYTRGRFVAKSPDSSLAERFNINDLAIVEGIVKGSETFPVGKESKTYPLIAATRVDSCRRAEGWGYVKGPTGWRKVDGPFCAEE
ncbi:MAG: hypothetical protein GF344_17845 [Chitinivibrionales bacterium]|nr:hypothetical protein [Chitinivibrionales bacterium]MBD3358528.1 hypothetical protein [Chitinivibrionales bacterium]